MNKEANFIFEFPKEKSIYLKYVISHYLKPLNDNVKYNADNGVLRIKNIKMEGQDFRSLQNKIKQE